MTNGGIIILGGCKVQCSALSPSVTDGGFAGFQGRAEEQHKDLV